MKYIRLLIHGNSEIINVCYAIIVFVQQMSPTSFSSFPLHNYPLHRPNTYIEWRYDRTHHPCIHQVLDGGANLQSLQKYGIAFGLQFS